MRGGSCRPSQLSFCKKLSMPLAWSAEDLVSLYSFPFVGKACDAASFFFQLCYLCCIIQKILSSENDNMIEITLFPDIKKLLANKHCI